MNLADLLKWHRGQVKLTNGDLREIHRGAVQLLTGVLQQRTELRDATLAGQAANRSAGKSSGGRTRIDPKIEASIIALLRQGVGTRAVMAEFGIGASTITRIKRNMGLPLGKPGRPAGE